MHQFPRQKYNILTKGQICGSSLEEKNHMIVDCFLSNIHLNLSEHCFQVSTEYIQVCEKKMEKKGGLIYISIGSPHVKDIPEHGTKAKIKSLFEIRPTFLT